MKCEYEFSAAYLSVVQLFIWNLHEYFVTSHLNSNMLCRHDDREISTYVTIIIAMNAVKKQQPQITKSYRLFTCLIITWLRSTLRSGFVSVQCGVFVFARVFVLQLSKTGQCNAEFMQQFRRTYSRTPFLYLL